MSLPFTELDTARCADYVRGLLLVSVGASVRQALCPSSSSIVATHAPGGGAGGGSTEKEEEEQLLLSPVDLMVKELPHATSNRVFVVVNQLGAGGSIIVKQYLPVHKTFRDVQLAETRMKSERVWADVINQLCPDKLARSLHEDEAQGIVIYERLEPHVMARLELVVGNRYPLLAEDISSYLSRVIFGTSTKWHPASSISSGVTSSDSDATTTTSDAITTAAMRHKIRKSIATLVDEYANNAGARDILIEQLIDGPFGFLPIGAGSAESSRFKNHHTNSLVLDMWEQQGIRVDGAILREANRLRALVTDSKEVLVHADFTTSSIMTAVIQSTPAKLDYETLKGPDEAMMKKMSEAEFEAFMLANTPTAVGDLRVIDGESAFVGPAGLDVGTILAHLFLALASARAKVRAQEILIAKGGYAKYSAEKTRGMWASHSADIAAAIADTWALFVTRIVDLWDASRGAATLPKTTGSGGVGHDDHHHHHHHDHKHDHTSSASGEGDCCGSETKDMDATASSSSSSSCCGEENTAPTVTYVDDGFWRTQVIELAAILGDALSFAGAELIRRVLGSAHVPELTEIQPIWARAATEARVLALGRYLLKNAAAIAKDAASDSFATASRETAVRVLAGALDVVVSGAAAIDGESGWKEIDTANPTGMAAAAGAGVVSNTTSTNASMIPLPGRPFVATLVVVASPEEEGTGADAAATASSESAASALVASKCKSYSTEFPYWVIVNNNTTQQPAVAGSVSGAGGGGSSATTNSSSLPANPSPLQSLLRRVWGPVILVNAADEVTKAELEAAAASADRGDVSTLGSRSSSSSASASTSPISALLAIPPHIAVQLPRTSPSPESPPLSNTGSAASDALLSLLVVA